MPFTPTHGVQDLIGNSTREVELHYLFFPPTVPGDLSGMTRDSWDVQEIFHHSFLCGMTPEYNYPKNKKKYQWHQKT